MSCGCSGGGNPYFLGSGRWRCGACGEDCLAVRPQGPDGDPGPAGITPTFEVGDVSGGGSPSVTAEAVSPTLYVLNFILPETYTLGDNIWTGSNTFLGDVIVSGSVLSALGGLTTAFLVVTEGSTFNGVTITGAVVLTSDSTLSVAGPATFNGPTVINGDASINGNLLVTGSVTFAGDVTFTFPALGTAQARGRLAIDSCDTLRYIEGSGFTEPDTVEDTNTVTVPAGDPETALCPAVQISPDAFTCGPNDVQYVEVMARVQCVFGFSALGSWAVNLWQGAIGGTLLDTFQAGPGVQQVVLRAIVVQVTPGATSNIFVSAVDGTDPPDSPFQSSAVKVWIK